jgi:hypothetical protein
VSALVIGSSNGRLLLLLLLPTSRLLKGAPAAGKNLATAATAAFVAFSIGTGLGATAAGAAAAAKGGDALPAAGPGASQAAVAADAFPAVLANTHFILLGSKVVQAYVCVAFDTDAHASSTCFAACEPSEQHLRNGQGMDSAVVFVVHCEQLLYCGGSAAQPKLPAAAAAAAAAAAMHVETAETTATAALGNMDCANKAADKWQAQG